MKKLIQKKSSSQSTIRLSKRQKQLVNILKPEHLLFANSILEGMSQMDAYRVVYPLVSKGSARSNGSRLITNANISEYIQESKQALALGSIHDRTWKRHTLIEVVERSMELQPLHKKGKEVLGKCEFDGAAVIKAISEMNRMDGDYGVAQHQPIQESHSDRIRRLCRTQPD